MATSKLQKKTKLNTVVDFTKGSYSKIEAEPAKIETQLDAAKQKFLTEKSITVSEKTLKSYNGALHLVFMFIPASIKRKPLNEWSQDDIDIIMSKIVQGKKINNGAALSPVTKESYLRNFRIFIKWCVGEGFLASNLFVKKYKAPQQPQKIYTEQEIYMLASEPELMHRLSFLEMRNYVMCRVLIETGIRKNSLLNLRICDLALETNTIQISKSKNKSIYTVTISDELSELLDRYLTNRIGEDTLETDVLFCDQFQRQLSEFGITNIMKKYVESKGVKWRGIHAFRHSCATMMIKNGATVAEVAQQTGHRDIRQVENYARIVTSISQEKFNKFSPLANMPKK